jgi:23S rRNA (uracil1939-C5)-methyltransferase
VTLVESLRTAAELAAQAAREQGIALTVHAMTLWSRPLASWPRASASTRSWSTPRRGLAPEVRRALAAVGARVVLYVSCAPGTLARDVDHLARLGTVPLAVVPGT